jgi:hypothetical protein
MHRVVLLFMVLLFGCWAVAQTSPTAANRDPQAIAILQQSLTHMTNGVPIADVILSGTATRIVGPDQYSGQVALEAKGTQESKISLSLSGFSFTEVRSFANGAATGSYIAGSATAAQPLAPHNCFTDPAWFFPALSSITDALGNTGTNVSYVGQQTLGGSSVDHILIWQSVSSPSAAAVKAIAHLSAMDWYLDSASALPVAVRFTTHPPNDYSLDLSVEVRFSNYQQTNGILVPLHVQKFLNGGLVLDLTFTSATLNSGISDTDFTLP